MTAFSNTPDEFIIAQVQANFGFITGETKPTPKGKGEPIPFAQLSFIHAAIFLHTFREGVKRGLFSPAEIAAAEEIISAFG